MILHFHAHSQRMITLRVPLRCLLFMSVSVWGLDVGIALDCALWGMNIQHWEPVYIHRLTVFLQTNSAANTYPNTTIPA